MILPVFFLFIFGVIEFGRMIWITSSLQYTCEETARYAMVNITATTTTLTAYAPTVFPGTSTSGIVFAATPDSVDGTNYMTISATYQYTPLIPLLDLVPITLTAKSRVPLIP